ncbi:hypothetical protein EV182_002116 [Spiromyces aspiralis]|uniref:Uncharacterized protein n=1 Tax=Spiromyces aspiralis TaxID=68401 RepID=A0ACC1HI24_9FUNG|nr:hypothetical protein EV182_002116 [Spiromyces aspiralis]
MTHHPSSLTGLTPGKLGDTSSSSHIIGAECLDASTSTLHLLIYAFLLHNNYGRTAEAFSSSCGLLSLGILSPRTSPRYLVRFPNADGEDGDSDDRGGREDVGSLDGKPSLIGGEVRTSRMECDDQVIREVDYGNNVVAGNASSLSAAIEKKQEEVESRMPQQQQQQQVAGMAGTVRNKEGSSDRTKYRLMHWGSKTLERHQEYLHVRQSTFQAIVAGEIDVAIDLITTYFPSVIVSSLTMADVMPTAPCRRLLASTMLRFRLDVQYFIELIRGGKILKALKFAQNVLHKYPGILYTWIEQTRILNKAEEDPCLDGNVAGINGEEVMAVLGHHQQREGPRLSVAVPLCKVSEQLNAVTGATGSAPRSSWHQETHNNNNNNDDTDSSLSSESSWELASCEDLKRALGDAQVHMTNAAALLAYRDPARSPVGYLLDENVRVQLAEDVNTAILLSLGFPAEPALATLVRQMTVVHEQLRSWFHHSSAGIDDPLLAKPWSLAKYLAHDEGPVGGSDDKMETD